METVKNQSIPSFEAAVRSGVLSRLDNPTLAESVTKAVIASIDAYEDTCLLRILEAETDETSVSVEDFLNSLKR